jgi:uncharacterized cupin superfamily protein
MDMSDDSSPENPITPIHRDEVRWETNLRDRQTALRWKHLAGASPGKPYQIGFVIEELMPGHKSSVAHWHTREEEHVYVVEGALTVRIGQHNHVMVAGSYVRFPADTPQEHTLFNHTQAPCRYILVGTRDRDDICYYPDINRLKIQATGEMFDRSDARPDWPDGT